MSTKIIFVTPSFFPHIGGVESHVGSIADELLKQGFEVTVITGSEQPTSSPKSDKQSLISREDDWGLSNSRLRVIYLGNTQFFSKLTIWSKIWQLRGEMTRADIVQAHDVGWWLLPVLPLILHKFNITFHGWEGVYPVRWQAKLHRLMLAILARKSVHIGHFIQQFYWDKPDLVMYGGLDEQLLEIKPTQVKKPLNIVFFGRLVAENEIELYMKLIGKLRKMDVAHTMLWIGDGAFAQSCQQLGKVTGMVADPSKYLRSADVVCTNSYLALLQAQAMGKIVVALFSHPLKAAYLHDYPGKEAMICTNSTEEAAKQLQTLLKNRQEVRSLQRTAQQLVAPYTWKAVANQYLLLWGMQKI